LYQEKAQDNPYLADFYKSGTNKYGYELQISLLTERFEQQQKINWNGKGAVQDRSIYEDSIFCKMLMEDKKIKERDYATYMQLSKIMYRFLGKPDLIVFLDISPEEAIKRLKMRNRYIESTVPLKYLQRLHEAYKDFISKISKRIRVISVDYKKYHFDYTTQEEFNKGIAIVAKKMAISVKKEWEKEVNVTYLK